MGIFDNNHRDMIADQIIDAVKQGRKNWIERVRLKAEMKMLDDFLPLTDIGILSGVEPEVFESVIKQTALEIMERNINEEGRTYCVLGATKDAYKRYLQSIGKWPTSGLLANWWFDSIEVEPQAEAPAVQGVSQSNESAELNVSGLLNTPSRKDSWFYVIDDMTRNFHKQSSSMPNEAQAWAQLSENPPEGYRVKTGTDRGEESLMMPGNKPLSKTAFSKRWKKYTTNKTQ